MIENLIRYESATGKTLAMWEFLPELEDGRRPSAGMVLIHGLGDYVMRYRDTAETLTAMGIAVVGIDLPGHGESEGKRGDVGRLSDVYTVINEARATLRELVEPIGGMVGALAHSTGGMLLFDYLTRFPGNFAFAWVNACLVEPLHRRSSRAAAIAKVAKVHRPDDDNQHQGSPFDGEGRRAGRATAAGGAEGARSSLSAFRRGAHPRAEADRVTAHQPRP